MRSKVWSEHYQREISGNWTCVESSNAAKPIVFGSTNASQKGDTMIPVFDSDKCVRHPNYRGIRKVRSGCEICVTIYESNKARGLKETRYHKKSYNEIVKENL